MNANIVLRIAAIIAFSLTTACGNQVKPLPQASAGAHTAMSNAPHAWGEETASHLNKAYSAMPAQCPSGGAAFRCSGVLLRATSNPAGTHAWDPSPSSIESGGISFSFLRADAKFESLAGAYTHGFVFYPYDEAPSDRLQPQVLCAFPLDAGTNGRESAGCGRQVGNMYPIPEPAKSAPCQSRDITTAQAWVADFNALGGSNDVKRHGQCGFDITGHDASEAFEASIEAMASIQSWLRTLTNELRIATWNMGEGAHLPISAFFYTTSAGRLVAQLDQTDYSREAGIVVPVIKLTLPKGSAAARFEFLEGDQSVIPVPPVSQAEPSVVEATGEHGRLLRLDDFRTRDFITVRIPRYEGMANGQRVNVTWSGSTSYTTDDVVVSTPGNIDLRIPRVEVVDNIGRTVFISFTVKSGNGEEYSNYLDLRIESQPIELGPPQVEASRTTAEVYYPELRRGDQVTLRVTGVAVRDTPPQPGTDGTPLSFAIPPAWMEENDGREVFVNYSVVQAQGAPRLFSQYLRLPPVSDGVENASVSVPQATGDQGRLLTIDNLFALQELDIRIPRYPGMLSGDELRVEWQGSYHWESAAVKVGTPGAVTIKVPRIEFVDSMGTTVPIMFTVVRSGQMRWSLPFYLAIEPQPLWLDAPTFDFADHTVTVYYPDLARGHQVAVRLTGVRDRDTEAKTASSNSPLAFDIPVAWLQENAGRTIAINYSVITATGARRQFSRYLRIPAGVHKAL